MGRVRSHIGRDIAQEMGAQQSHVSKLPKLAMKEGWLRREGREYVLVTPRAKMSLTDAEAKEAAFGQGGL